MRACNVPPLKSPRKPGRQTPSGTAGAGHLSPTPAGGLVVTENREAMTTNIFSAHYPRPPGGYSSPGEKHSIFLFSSLGEFGDIYLRIFFFSEIYFGVFFLSKLVFWPMETFFEFYFAELNYGLFYTKKYTFLSYSCALSVLLQTCMATALPLMNI